MGTGVGGGVIRRNKTGGGILVVDDDPAFRALVVAALAQAGFEPFEAESGAQALEQAARARPSLVILDVRLPDLSGYEVCRELRDRFGASVPVLFVSGERIESFDRVAGLLVGGDDYLAKPFGMNELVARVKAAIRRAGAVAGGSGREKVEVPGLVIDPDLHRAILDGEDAELTRTEFRLLSVLASERGRVMTRDQLQQRVWGTPYRPRDRSVDVCVRKLREKLDQRSRGYSYIHTHYGVGYRFDAEPIAASAQA